MKIPTWGDAQAVALPCCDCVPNTFNIPTEFVNEYQRGDGGAFGFTNPQDSEEDQLDKIYLVRKTTYKNDNTIQPPKNPAGAVITETYLNPYSATVSNAAGTRQISTRKQEEKRTGGDSFKGPATIEYSSPLTRADARAELKDMILAEIDLEQDSFVRTSSIYANDIEGGIMTGSGFNVSLTHGRMMIRHTDDFEDNDFYSKNYYLEEWTVWLMTFTFNTYLSDWNRYLNEKKVHDKWEQCMIDNANIAICGNEPITPEKPEDLPPEPILLTVGSYEYEQGPPDSGWMEIPMTDTTTLEDDLYFVNMENVFITPYRWSRGGIIPNLVSSRYIDPADPVPN